VATRVLVTGAGGFIGSHLVDALVRSGADVRAFVRYTSRSDDGWLADLAPEVFAEVEVFRGDLVNPEAVTGALDGRERVFHLGALIPIPYSYRHPREFVAANVTGTLNVLEAARRADVARVVHTSTSEVYGTPLDVPVPETARLHAQSPYAASKVAADQLAGSYHASFGVPVVTVRPFNTYGPRQSARAVIPTIVTQALARGEIELGALAPTRDFLFVGDTVRGFLAAADAAGVDGEAINLGTGREISIGALVRLILDELQLDLPVREASERLRPADSEVERLLADAAKASALLGWEPAVRLEEGLRRTIEWLRGSLDAYRPSRYTV
jgi:dTDP-glucose 4,6-dehydratase